jgi:hypothetical protein
LALFANPARKRVAFSLVRFFWPRKRNEDDRGSGTA